MVRLQLLNPCHLLCQLFLLFPRSFLGDFQIIAHIYNQILLGSHFLQRPVVIIHGFAPVGHASCGSAAVFDAVDVEILFVCDEGSDAFDDFCGNFVLLIFFDMLEEVNISHHFDAVAPL